MTRRQALLGGAALALTAPMPARADEIPLPAGKVRVLVDTDAGNYFDDQFALAHAALSPESIRIEAVYAAPFANGPIAVPEDGMEASYEEIRRLLAALGLEDRIPVLRGARQWLGTPGPASRNPASEDLIGRVMAEDARDLYVVAIGTATNVATALQLEPRLAGRVNVIWLGGTPHHFPSAAEFNLKQDLAAARVLFDSGVRLLHVPAPGVAENVRATPGEIERQLRDTSSVGNYLVHRVAEKSPIQHEAQRGSRTLSLWDMTAVAWLVNPQWVESIPAPSPLLAETMEWQHGSNRHQIRVAIRVLRDAVLTDFFAKAAAAPD